MQYKAELRPFVKKDGQKYKVIQFTDIQFHIAERRPTPSFGKKVREAFQQNAPGRVYTPLPKPATRQDHNSLILEMLGLDTDFVKMVQEEEAKGYKILIGMPNGGIPVLLGKDTIEFLDSKNGKRLLRGLDKNKT